MKKKINLQDKIRKEAMEISNEATVLCEKVQQRIESMNDGELTPADALLIMTESTELKKTCLDIENLDYGKLFLPTEETLTLQKMELESLKKVTISELSPVELLRFVQKVIRIEWACQGIPENVVCTH
ncbi:Uncharacterised protein [uncultured archaeon]|nr:Uncharacterised protein [uncultured archaeon]